MGKQGTYKLYKAKKLWITALAAMSLVTVAAGLQSNTVAADSSVPNSANQSTSNGQSAADDNLKVTVNQSNFEKYFTLGGGATYDSQNNLTTLTQASNGQRGNITLNTLINANDSFVLHGTINIGSKLDGLSGADGIGIAFHHGVVGSIGFAAGGISVKGLPKSTGFVFDTWTLNQGDHDDGTPYLSGFTSDINQTYPDQPFHYLGQPYDISPSLATNKDVPFTLSYDGKGNMSISYLNANITIPVVDYQDPLALSIGASTGAYNNLQTVRINDFTFNPAQNINISRTVNYVDQSGNKIAASTVQEAIYRRQGTLVDGLPTYSDWQLASQQGSNNFSAVTAPTIDGYTIASGQQSSFNPMTVSNNSGQLVYNVVYNKNSGQTTLNVQDSTIVSGPNATWDPAQNYLSAVDQNGQPVDLSRVKVSGQVDTTKAGTYPVTYTYTDTNGKTISKTATVTVIPSKSQLQAHDSTIYQGTNWNGGQNIDLAHSTDGNGNTLALKDVQVDGNVDTSKPGAYPISYTYVDGSGNERRASATVTVVPDQSGISAHDSKLIAGPNKPWTAADNFTSGTAANGQPLDLSQVTVSGNVDTTKAGVYTATYSYTDESGKQHSAVATVTVVASQGQVSAHDSDLIAGPNTHWTAADNFTGATDANGQPVDLSQVKVSGNVDTTKAGTYPVTYSYTDSAGNEHSTVAQVKVSAGQGQISVHNSDLIAGPNTHWTAADNFTSATDVNGQPVDFSQVKVSGNVDTTKAGTYPVTYSYTDSTGNEHVMVAQVTVNTSQGRIIGHDSTLIAGPNTHWSATDNFAGAADANGQPVDLSKVKIDGSVDTMKPGVYPVTYTYTDSTGDEHSKTISVTVTSEQGSLKAHDSTLVAGPNTQWHAVDNFSQATDVNGQPVDFNRVQVSGTVDTTKPGTYLVTYTYTEGNGDRYAKTIAVVVEPSQSGVCAHSSTLVAGSNTKWTAADNFSGAVDTDGQPINLSQVTVTGQPDTTKPGTYPVTYSYTDSKGNQHETKIVVTVVADESDIKVHDSTVIAGPNTQWTAADNFSGATDVDGQAVDLKKEVTVTGQPDTTKPGTYPVTYSYTNKDGDKYSRTVIVTVTSDQGELRAHDSTLTAGPDTRWTAADNFTGATDVDGQPVDLSRVKVSGNVDTTKPGAYAVTYAFTDSNGDRYEQKIVVTVDAAHETTDGGHTSHPTQNDAQDSKESSTGQQSNLDSQSSLSPANSTPAPTDVQPNKSTNSNAAPGTLPKTGQQLRRASQLAVQVLVVTLTLGLILMVKSVKKNSKD